MRAALIMRAALAALIAASAIGASVGCGAQSSAAPGDSARSGAAAGKGSVPTATLARSDPKPHPPAAPVVTPAHRLGSAWRPVVRVAGAPAAWEAQQGGVTLLRFDQRLARLILHAGQGEPAGRWPYGDRIGRTEIHRVVAAFNGGFKFETGVVGYMSQGRVAVPLQAGFGSIVTYRDGTTQIGAWRNGVPVHGRPIASVLQNLHLLVDHGVAASTIEGCIQSCWGATVGGVDVVARSALGITGDGQLVWAAGESLTPADLARALIGAGAQRAVELDINPDWVAGYLYVHGGSGPRAVPVVPGQLGISGRFLSPYTRDFFTVVAR
jgi:hypothetical protein